MMIWYPETAIGADITDTDYFEVSPWKDYISNSKLGLLDPSHGGSMALFLKSWKNTKRSKSLQHGTIVHSLLLQADNYGVSDILRPTGKLGDMVYDTFRLRTRDNPLTIEESINTVIKLHNYYSGKPSAKIIQNAIAKGFPYYKHLMIYKNNEFILNSEEVDIVLGCLEGLKANQQSMDCFFPPDKNIQRFNEFTVACKLNIKDRDYTVKIKIDNWTLDLKNKVVTMNDLKTTGVNIDNFMNGYWEVYPTSTEDIRIFHPGSFQKYSYFRQMAMYTMVLENYIIKTYGFKPKIQINIVAIETKDPFRSVVFDLGEYYNNKFSQRQLEFGQNQFQELMLILANNEYIQTIEGIDQLPQAFI